MSVDNQEDGRTRLLTLVEEYGGKYDNGAVAMVALGAMAFNTHIGLGPFRADWQKNDRAYLDSTGFAVPLAMQRLQFLEGMIIQSHATTRDRVGSGSSANTSGGGSSRSSSKRPRSS